MDDEPILCHEPDFMPAVLRAARQESARLDDALVQLQAHLAAHEPGPTRENGRSAEPYRP
jgi:hypothetical protein